MTFTADVDGFIKKTKGALEAVAKQSIQDVVQDAQTSRFKGGNIPIDTSFLINSGKAEIERLPVGEGERPPSFTLRDWDDSEFATTLNRLRVGETFYFGWTANYARFMENRYKFMRLAAQKWSQYIDANSKEVKRRLNL